MTVCKQGKGSIRWRCVIYKILTDGAREAILALACFALLGAIFIGLPWLLVRLQSLRELWADLLVWTIILGLLGLGLFLLVSSIVDEVKRAIEECRRL